MELVKDIWRCAIVGAPLARVVARGSLEGLPLTLFPDLGSFRYAADPFGLWRGERLYVFAETFDYRVAVGRIEVFVFDRALRFLERLPVLAEPWHLSYPQVFEAEGETWLLPEAAASGRLTFYRAVEFPTRWEAAFHVAFDPAPIDATPLWHEGRWWLFYTPAGTPAERVSVLQAAHAPRLAGPWTQHPLNPLRVDRAAARPGGTPLVAGGRIVLPVQDSARTYGDAVRLLEIAMLTPESFVATPDARLVAPAAAAPFVRGAHTLSAAGEVTLIDVKRRHLSLGGMLMRPRRDLAKAMRRLGRVRQST